MPSVCRSCRIPKGKLYRYRQFLKSGTTLNVRVLPPVIGLNLLLNSAPIFGSRGRSFWSVFIYVKPIGFFAFPWGGQCVGLRSHSPCHAQRKTQLAAAGCVCSFRWPRQLPWLVYLAGKHYRR